MRNMQRDFPSRGITYYIFQILLVILTIVLAGFLINADAQTISHKQGLADDYITKLISDKNTSARIFIPQD